MSLDENPVNANYNQVKVNENQVSDNQNTGKIQSEMEENELEEYADHELDTFDKESLRYTVKQLETQISKSRPNLGILQEYRAKMAEYHKKSQDLKQSTEKRDSIKQQFDDLRKKRLEEFMHGFTKISQKLKEMYQVCTCSTVKLTLR